MDLSIFEKNNNDFVNKFIPVICYMLKNSNFQILTYYLLCIECKPYTIDGMCIPTFSRCFLSSGGILSGLNDMNLKLLPPS